MTASGMGIQDYLCARRNERAREREGTRLRTARTYPETGQARMRCGIAVPSSTCSVACPEQSLAFLRCPRLADWLCHCVESTISFREGRTSREWQAGRQDPRQRHASSGQIQTNSTKEQTGQTVTRNRRSIWPAWRVPYDCCCPQPGRTHWAGVFQNHGLGSCFRRMSPHLGTSSCLSEPICQGSLLGTAKGVSWR